MMMVGAGNDDDDDDDSSSSDDGNGVDVDTDGSFYRCCCYMSVLNVVSYVVVDSFHLLCI